MKTLSVLFVFAALVVADDKAADANKKDLEKMQGDWIVVKAERGGEAMPEEITKTFKRVVKGDTSTVTFDAGMGEQTIASKIKLDAGKTPKEITATRDEGGDAPGIYEFDGDIMKICLAPPGEERPKEFKTKEGTHQTLIVWKKKK